MPPPMANIVRTGKTTSEKLNTAPASWTVKCTLPDSIVVQIDVVSEKSRRSWEFSVIGEGQSHKLARIVQKDGFWYVQEKDHLTKARPYEAELHFLGGYLFLPLSTLHCIVDGEQLACVELQSRSSGQLSYRVPLPVAARRALEQMISDYDKLASHDPSFLQDKDAAQNIKRAREQLSNGTPVLVDEKWGIVTEVTVHEMKVSVESFRWLSAAPDTAFEIPRSITWETKAGHGRSRIWTIAFWSVTIRIMLRVVTRKKHWTVTF